MNVVKGTKIAVSGGKILKLCRVDGDEALPNLMISRT